MAISINIHGGLDERTTQVSATGYEEHVITDTETKTFHLTDSELKSAV
jgi:alpha-acetolactate decarboxylase